MSDKPRKWNGPTYRRVAIAEAQRVRDFSHLELRVWIEARMGRQSARLGCGEFSPARLAEDLDHPNEDTRAAFAHVCAALGWTYDAVNRWLLIPDALAVAWDGSADQLTGYRREIERQAPPIELLKRFDVVVAQLKGETTGDTSTQTTGGTTPQTTGGIVLVHELELVQVHEHDHTSSPSAPVPSPDDVQQIWNEITTAPIPKCKELTPQRRKHAAARLKERGLDGMREVFTAINAVPFLRGESDRGWCANFDWALKPANIAKVLEGVYASSPNRGRSSNAPGRTGAPAPDKYRSLMQSDDMPKARAS